MNGWEVMEHAAELVRRGEAFALATVVWRQGPSSSQLGSRAIITADGELRGWIGGACAEPAVIRAATHVIATGSAELLLLGNPDQFGGAVPEGVAVIPISCQSEGALEVYIEPVVPVPHLVVVGRSPMAQTLAELARALGWHAELIDGADFTAARVDGQSLVVVATQGHDDEGVLERAVTAHPAYVGLVGSRKRGAAVLGYLADRGLPKAELDRVRVPAGLDLGSTTHPEIAVAILAELVQLRASGALAGGAGVPGSAGESGGPNTASGQAGSMPRQPGQATDPVCGMSVGAGPDALTLVHAGVTYYFCRAACRQAFEKDPAAHTVADVPDMKGEARC
jgi:xanthine dehydrogenase accessory factor